VTECTAETKHNGLPFGIGQLLLEWHAHLREPLFQAWASYGPFLRALYDILNDPKHERFNQRSMSQFSEKLFHCWHPLA
jgi:hypothetical protein